MRQEFFIGCICLTVIYVASFLWFPLFLWSLIVVAPVVVLGLYDALQTRRAILRNFPLLGRFRYLFEMIRPEISQYFIETNESGRPLNREQRSVVYQRSKHVLDTIPFGTQHDVYAEGYEWLNHSLLPVDVDSRSLRLQVGGEQCAQPYDASIYNISAMSYGALSDNAVLALNGGAKDGHFAHNTGEGGVTEYHQRNDGDLIWQIGTGYFGCRDAKGNFSPEKYREKSVLPQVKMIELKLSQGAKPSHGGILPAAKVSAEIAQIRGVSVGEDVISPPSHSAFRTPLEMMHFIQQLRELSGGKPVGFKLCIGKRREFLALCKAMIQTGILPDYILVDGGEGGTGAAPLEFSNRIGSPGIEALVFVRNALTGFGLGKKIRIGATGKATNGFALIKLMALGADFVFAARPFLLSLGCIQALRCNSNHCPTGITTQKRSLVAGLHVPNKRVRVKSFHEATMKSVAEMLGAMGMSAPEELRPWHVMRRTSMTEIHHFGELFEYVDEGSFLKDPIPTSFSRALALSSAESFRHVG